MKHYHSDIHDILHQGVRFDSKTMHWFLLKEHLSLSSSYLTFVIIEHKYEILKEIQQRNVEGLEETKRISSQVCDSSNSNFVQFGKTIFHYYPSIILYNTEILENLLVAFEAINPIMLELLNVVYVEDGKKVSALSIAMEGGNTRAVDIILKYMAKTERSPMCLFKNLIKDLIEQPSILEFMNSLSIENQNMKTKVSLRCDSEINDNFVAIANS